MRDKSILAGLYLSKFNRDGLNRLGFASFNEAFNVIGAALGARPASIKNYRDEFDPLFPNNRKGWHKRSIREHCKAVYEEFGRLTLNRATILLKSMVYRDGVELLTEEAERIEGGRAAGVSFAKRLVTGQAAEQYFRVRYKEVDVFKDLEIEDTTRAGCGFDF